MWTGIGCGYRQEEKLGWEGPGVQHVSVGEDVSFGYKGGAAGGTTVHGWLEY